ncbi:MAG: SprT-like domain-containing protein [Nitrospira sp.]|nr:SprT-like domain-containing protein [Nitrospira sp.]
MRRPWIGETTWLLPTRDELQTRWQYLNGRYFSGSLPSIAILWSPRLTSSVGMFTSRGGPRTSIGRGSREIRLSLPLFVRLDNRTPYAEQELLNTIAHEMIHQWQFDLLKRRPDHGLAFLRKMTEMNRTGEMAITTYHSLEQEVLALSRFAWRCTDCGRTYRRQRKTIQPGRHRCGVCRGSLVELLLTGPAVKSRLVGNQPHLSNLWNSSAQLNRSTGEPQQLTLQLM